MYDNCGRMFFCQYVCLITDWLILIIELVCYIGWKLYARFVMLHTSV